MHSLRKIFKKSSATKSTSTQTNSQPCVENNFLLTNLSFSKNLSSQELKESNNASYRTTASLLFINAKQTKELRDVLYVINFARVFKELRLSTEPPAKDIIQIIIKNSKYIREITQIIFMLDTYRLPLTANLISCITQHGRFGKAIHDTFLKLTHETFITKFITEEILIGLVKKITQNALTEAVETNMDLPSEIKIEQLAAKKRLSLFQNPGLRETPLCKTMGIPSFNISFTDEKPAEEGCYLRLDTNVSFS